MISIELSPRAVQRIVSQIAPGRYDEKTAPERFTAREQVCHLADWEPIWLERFEAGLKNPGARIVAYDEGQFAIDGKYAERDIVAEAERYIAGRKRLADRLRQLRSDDWDITIDHPERGILTLGDLANMILGHDMYHVENLTQFLGEKTAGTW